MIYLVWNVILKYGSTFILENRIHMPKNSLLFLSTLVFTHIKISVNIMLKGIKNTLIFTSHICSPLNEIVKPDLICIITIDKELIYSNVTPAIPLPKI